MHTILVIGGYGFFGARISAALAQHPGIRVLIGGRSDEACRRMAQELELAPEQAVRIDAQGPGLHAALVELGVGSIIHAAGPFQGQHYTVARAAIEAGSLSPASMRSIPLRGHAA